MVMYDIGSTLSNHVLGKAANKSANKIIVLILACNIVVTLTYITARYNIWMLYGVIFLL